MIHIRNGDKLGDKADLLFIISDFNSVTGSNLLELFFAVAEIYKSLISNSV